MTVLWVIWPAGSFVAGLVAAMTVARRMGFRSLPWLGGGLALLFGWLGLSYVREARQCRPDPTEICFDVVLGPLLVLNLMAAPFAAGVTLGFGLGLLIRSRRGG